MSWCVISIRVVSYHALARRVMSWHVYSRTYCHSSIRLVLCHVMFAGVVMSCHVALCRAERRLTRRPLLRSCYADVTAYCWRHVAGFVWEGTMVQCLILFLLSFLSSLFSSSFDPFIPDFLAFFRLLFITPLFFTVFLFPSFFSLKTGRKKREAKKRYKEREKIRKLMKEIDE